MIAAPPSLPDRLLSAGYYLGLAPVTGLWRSPASNHFLQHHYAQAMAALSGLLMLLLAVCLFDTAECVTLIQLPGFEEQVIKQFGSLPTDLDYAELVLIVALIALWVTLLGLCLAGSLRQVPLLKRLMKQSWVVRVSFLANCFVLILIPLFFVLVLWATSLTRRSSGDAKVYFLYDEGISVPRWGYALGLCRISLQADRNWGKGSTVLDQLNKETLRRALACGRVVILATHGDDGYAQTYYSPEILRVSPADTGVKDEKQSSRFLRISVQRPDHKLDNPENVEVSNRLQLAYVFACNGGKRASQWREHLAPAQVITYNRVSTVLDHALWFALTGPSQLKQLR